EPGPPRSRRTAGEAPREAADARPRHGVPRRGGHGGGPGRCRWAPGGRYRSEGGRSAGRRAAGPARSALERAPRTHAAARRPARRLDRLDTDRRRGASYLLEEGKKRLTIPNFQFPTPKLIDLGIGSWELTAPL